MQNTPSSATPARATDAGTDDERLGAGATVITSVLALLVGFVVGGITTFTHGAVEPWGLIAGLAIVAALIGGFRLVFASRVVAAAAALGIIGASALLAAPGAGGAALSLDGFFGYAWAFAPALLAVVILLLPRPGRRTGA
jgi:N-acetyl-1-D-myo-inositol-2-amino-2-deoxy-alpha-D-glucopyranoside deacetylase